MCVPNILRELCKQKLNVYNDIFNIKKHYSTNNIYNATSLNLIYQDIGCVHMFCAHACVMCEHNFVFEFKVESNQSGSGMSIYNICRL